MNLSILLSSLLAKTKLGKTDATRISHNEQVVGAGFYALRENISKSGKRYFKLVQADRGSAPKLRAKGVPSVGSRNDRPSTRRARRNVPIS